MKLFKIKLPIIFGFFFLINVAFAAVPEHVSAFYEMRGRNLARFEDAKFLVGSGKVRWVEGLDMHWATKKKADWGIEDEKRWVLGGVHDELSTIGTTVKMFRGLRSNLEDLTPESKNFLIPYVSFVLKDNAGNIEFVCGDYLRIEGNDKATIFTSGGKTEEPEELINVALIDGKRPKVRLIAGDNINGISLQRCFRFTLHDKGSFFYTAPHKKAFIQRFKRYYSDLARTFSGEEVKKEAFNPINCTLEVLLYLVDNNFTEITSKRSDTLDRLNDLLKGKDQEKFDCNADQANLAKIKQLKEVALKRINDELSKLNFLTVDQKKIGALFVCLGYLVEGSSLDPKWEEETIKDIGLIPEYSMNGKKFDALCRESILPSWHNYSKEHTEYFLTAFVRAHPETILNPLKKLKEEKPERVALKAIVLDMHSSLDICKFCKDSLYQEWAKALQLLTDEIGELGFALPKSKKVRTLIRMSSEKQYQDHPKSHLLLGAGGGMDIKAKGFEAKTVMKKGTVIAQRRELGDTILRDRVLLTIQQKLMELCLYKPYSFWTSNIRIFDQLKAFSHPSAVDLFIVLANRHRDHFTPFIMAATDSFRLEGETTDEKIDTLIPLLESVITSEADLSAEEHQMLNFLKVSPRRLTYYNAHTVSYVKDYAKTFYGKFCLEKLKRKKLRESLSAAHIFEDAQFKTFLDYGVVAILSKADKANLPALKAKLPTLRKAHPSYETPEEYEDQNITNALNFLEDVV